LSLIRGDSLKFRARIWLTFAITVAVSATSCAVSKKTAVPPAQARTTLEATPSELIEKYNRQAKAIQSLNATVKLKATAGSQYSGVVEQYHEVNGFILAQRPAKIRVIGQAPVVNKNIFDMVSDGETFRIFIPSKHRFITGPAKFEKPAEKPIENLRPQHLVDALFWDEIREDAPVLFEETENNGNREYVLTVLHGTRRDTDFEIERKIRFDRADLNVAEIENLGASGKLASVVHYSDWQPADGAQFARDIRVERPHDGYQLDIQVTKLAVNETIAADRFHLDQPPGTELVEVGKEEKESKP
jgi:outer membrane lipoprotein-sorting protein